MSKNCAFLGTGKMHFATNVLSLALIRTSNWLQTSEPVYNHRELQMVENQHSFLAEIHKGNVSHYFFLKIATLLHLLGIIRILEHK